MKAKNRRWQVRHDAGRDYGLTPPDFPTRGEACYWRDKWNAECPGHTVNMIEKSNECDV